MDLEIVYLKPEELTPYEGNTRKHAPDDVEQIKESIKADGFNDPIGIWGEKNIIVEGHGRRIAAMELGLERVPCIRLDHLTETQRRDYAIRHNFTSDQSEFDFDKLREEVAALEIEGLDMSYLDSLGEELQGMTGESLNDYQITEDEPPQPPEEPMSKRGQIWQLGRHRLMCGDSTDAGDVDRLMDGEEADLLLTDPPYNVNLGSIPTPTDTNIVPILNDSMSESDFIVFLTAALTNAQNHLRGGAAWYVFYTGLHHIEFESAVRNVPEFKMHEQLVWVKSHFVLGRNSDYQWAHELCLYGWKTGEAHYFSDSRAESTVIEDSTVKLSTMKKGDLIALCEKLMGQNQSTTVLRADKPMSADLHPTVKPQELIGRLMINSSKPGWRVLDLFGGSGSTLIACEQLNRQCFMMELDPHYVDVIIQRWETFTGDKAVLLNG
jgi:DNA modification methylase